MILFLLSSVTLAGDSKYKLVPLDHPLLPEPPGIFEAFGLGDVQGTVTSSYTFNNDSGSKLPSAHNPIPF